MNALSSLMIVDPSVSPGLGSYARQVRDIVKELVRASEPPAPPTGTPFDVLEPTIRGEVWPRWKEPCEAAFEYLAERHPKALLHLISSSQLEAADLTFAAEIAGRLSMSREVRATLLPLLRHEEAVVREGAVYGLAHLNDPVVRAELKKLAGEDASVAVRTAAGDRLARE